MTAETTTAKRLHCPFCDKQAKRVSPVTLQALLKDQFAVETGSVDHSCSDSNGEGCTSITEDTGWRFCDSTDCDVVYFSEEGTKQFTKSQLVVPVGVKETSGERPLCYCFGHSVASIKDELRTKGRSDALEDIRAKMKAPGCHCETSNPSGSCCLGNVASGIKLARNELEEDTSKLPPSSHSSRGEAIAKVGTIISAVMASACCWLPLLLLAVGVSGAGVAATLESYRPLFMVLTFGFLGAAFYFTYRPKKTTATIGNDCCASESTEGESCCPTTAKSGFNMMALNKVMLRGVTLLAVAFLFFPSYVGALFGTPDHSVVSEDMNQAVFKIEGMTCEGCATTVDQAIRQVPGVMAVEVNYEEKEAVVGVDSSQPVRTERIIEELKKAGYQGELQRSTTSADGIRTPATLATQPVSRVDKDTANESSSEPLRQTVLRIDGMTCEGCATALSDSIQSLPGIAKVQVDFKSGNATIHTPACCSSPKEAVLTAVQESGFKGQVVEPQLTTEEK